VASLGLVSTGAATDGVTAIFPPNLATISLFFSHRPFLPAVFHLATSILQYSLEIRPQFFFHSGVTPAGCYPGRSAPSFALPSDATGRVCRSVHVYKQGTYSCCACSCMYIVEPRMEAGQLVFEFNLCRVRNDVIWLVASCFRMFFLFVCFPISFCVLASFFVHLGTIYVINK